MRLQTLLSEGLAAIEEADGLDDIAEQLQDVVVRATSDTATKNLLSGVWLGHPVHPPLTDVAIGALTSATLLDLLPGTWSRRGADALVALGLLATVPTAITGANDWADTKGATRRMGFVHASANGLAGLLYGASFASRLRGRRAAGVTLGALGMLALTAGGTLGGHLAYRLGIGVDENVFTTGVTDWQSTIADEDLPGNEPTLVTADGVDIVLFRSGQRIHAVADRCSHLGGPLHEGQVHEEQCQLSCPWHHSTFNLEDGSVARGPATAPQPTFETRVRDGKIEVRRTQTAAG